MKSLYNFGKITILTAFFSVFFLFIALPVAHCQITFFTEDFEDHGNTAFGGLGRYSSPADFYDTAGDYWGRVNGTTSEYWLINFSLVMTISTTVAYSGWNGGFYYAGEDVDDIGAVFGTPDGNPVKEITFSGININGGTNLAFKGLFAAGENNPCGSSVYDYDVALNNTDFIKVFYNIDGAGEIEALCFTPDVECSLPTKFTNEPLHHDPNCDGDGGEGTALTAAFSEYGFNIAGTGTSMDLIVRVSMNGGTEEAAVDFLRLMSDTPIITATACTADNGVLSISVN